MTTLAERAKAQTRTEETQVAYVAAGLRHAHRAGALTGLQLDFELLVRSLEAEKGVLRPASTRLYSAEVSTLIQVWGAQAGLAPERIAELVERIRTSFAARSGKPEQQRTASKKVKNAWAEEIRLILDDLQARMCRPEADLADRVTSDFIAVLAMCGARPSEVLGARLEGDDLVLPTAKATNERGNGPTRPFSLLPFGEAVRARVERMLPRIRELIIESISVGRDEKGLLKLLAERLARSCTRVRGRRLSLYSFRHAAIAAWTKMGFSPAEIAALAGQVSIHTAPRHYSRSRNGLEMAERPIPCPEVVRAIEARHGIGKSPELEEPITTRGHTIEALASDFPLERDPATSASDRPNSVEIAQSSPTGQAWQFEPFPAPAATRPDNRAKARSDDLGRAAKARVSDLARQVEASALGIRQRESHHLMDSIAKGEDHDPTHDRTDPFTSAEK